MVSAWVMRSNDDVRHQLPHVQCALESSSSRSLNEQDGCTPRHSLPAPTTVWNSMGASMSLLVDDATPPSQRCAMPAVSHLGLTAHASAAPIASRGRWKRLQKTCRRSRANGSPSNHCHL